MTAIIKTKHRVRLAKNFLENFDDTLVDRNHYVFIGKSDPWGTEPAGTGGGSETTPPAPLDTVAEDYVIWDKMVALKKVSEDFVSHVIPRLNWDASGETVYARYDAHDPELHLHPTQDDIDNGNLSGYTPGGLYVLTDEFHVFKCLNNASGSKSTQKPTLPSAYPFIVELSDGYRWKYMYTIPTEAATKFLTDRWMPVINHIQESRSGAIESFCIENVGSEYHFVQQSDDLFEYQLVSSGATTVTLYDDSISSDSDADTAFVGCHIFMTSGNSQGEVRKIQSYSHVTKVANLVDIESGSPSGFTDAQPGDRYDLLPAINIDGNGTGLLAKCVIDTVSETLQSIEIINTGENYTHVTATLSGGRRSSGEDAIVMPCLPPSGGHGSDAINELGSFFVMLNAKLQPTIEDFPQVNDYRQIGLIRNVEDFGGGISTDSTRTAVQKIVLKNYVAGVGGDFQSDELINFDDITNQAQAKIVEFKDLGSGGAEITFWQDSTTEYYDISTLNFATLQVTGTVTGATGDAADTDPFVDREVSKNSGEILWVEYRRRITRSPDQTEDIKLILEF
jgi:hypothetical protein